MSEGFSEEKIEVAIYKDEVKKLLKKYKKIIAPTIILNN